MPSSIQNRVIRGLTPITSLNNKQRKTKNKQTTTNSF